MFLLWREISLKFISEKYACRVVRKIADGGMGTVYEAIQSGVEGFEKTVAVKTLLSQFSNDSRFLRMFIDEAKLVANLVHENIVQIYQLGKDDDEYFIIYEYVNGISLREFLDLHHSMHLTLPPELAVFIASRIARGLAYAHSRCDAEGHPLEIVHQDVCPNNILISTEGLPKLTDFGIAKAATNLEANSQRGVAGKLPYMSPEQGARKPVDKRSDIYSLGMVLFEMLAGTNARDLNPKALLECVISGQIDWGKLPDSLDDALVGLLKQMMARNRDDRYDRAEMVAHDLEYHIYKEGYGPTIQTLETYMRRECAYLYRSAPSLPLGSGRQNAVIDKTVVL
jgi:serine/threonine protein kinase